MALTTALRSPHVGTVGALVGCVWEGFIFAGPLLGVGRSERWEYAGYVLLGTAVSAAYTVYRLTRENLRLKARFAPKVRVCHEPGKRPNYVREANMRGGVTERRHMVGIVNEGGVKLKRIRVMAERFEPYLQGATWLERPLHPLGSRADDDGWFDLSVGDGKPTGFVEVFQELKGLDGLSYAVLACIYDSPSLNDLKRYMDGHWFAVVLRVEGDIKPYRFKLMARRTDLGWFEVLEGDIDVETMSNGGGDGYHVVTLSTPDMAAPPSGSAL